VKVICDVDNVLADYSSRYLGCLYAATGRRYTHRDLTDFSFRKALALSEEEDRKTVALVRKNLDFAELPFAVEAVRKMAKVHQVIFVTTPHALIPEWTWHRDQWLAKRFPKAQVIHTRHKHLVHGGAIIDDREENVIDWLDAHPLGLGVLWAQPHNSPIRSKRSVRTDDWSLVHRLLGVADESTEIAEGRAP
jgi:5'(3')-deoxyribonucleotidase